VESVIEKTRVPEGPPIVARQFTGGMRWSLGNPVPEARLKCAQEPDDDFACPSGTCSTPFN